MSDTKPSLSEQATDFKNQASVKLGELKEEADKLGEQIKDSAEDAWEKLKTVDVKGEFNHLKAETGDLVDGLAEKAKGLWSRMTGSKDEDGPQPQDGPVK